MKEVQNVYQSIFEANSDNLEKTALVYRSIRTTYGALLNQVEEMATLLISYGVQTGYRVALRSPDSTIHIILALALLKIGAVQIPVEFSLRSMKLEISVNRSARMYLSRRCHYLMVGNYRLK